MIALIAFVTFNQRPRYVPFRPSAVRQVLFSERIRSALGDAWRVFVS